MSKKECDWLIYASQVSAAIGQNKYKKRWEVMLEMWQRINPVSYAAAIDRNKIRSKAQIIQDAMIATQMSDKYEQVTNTKITSSTIVQQVVDDFTHILDDKMQTLREEKKQLEQNIKDATEPTNIMLMQQQLKKAKSALDDCKVLRKETSSQVKTKYGSEQEKILIESKQLGVILDNNDKFYFKKIGTVGGKNDGLIELTWGIGGRIDGFRNGILVEIKNRVNRLFDLLPDYDIIQIQCYMQVLDQQQALMIQRLVQNNKKPEVRETLFKRDNFQWNNHILPKLEQFINGLHTLITNENAQDRLLSTPDCQKFRVANSLCQ